MQVYSGTGNTFIICDRCSPQTPLAKKDIFFLCAKENVDGFIVLEPSKTAHYSMTFFNRDGSQASMCGNGIRCLFRYILDTYGFDESHCTIAVQDRVYTLQKKHNSIAVLMGKVVSLKLNIQFEEKKRIGHLIDSGVPHLVLFVDDVNQIDVHAEGSYFRNHPNFLPHGTNVNFVDKMSQIRTFERGVEAETLSCGTGVTAAAFATHTILRKPYPMQFKVASQETLTVEATVKGLLLSGEAHFVRSIEYAYVS